MNTGRKTFIQGSACKKNLAGIPYRLKDHLQEYSIQRKERCFKLFTILIKQNQYDTFSNIEENRSSK